MESQRLISDDKTRGPVRPYTEKGAEGANCPWASRRGVTSNIHSTMKTLMPFWPQYNNEIFILTSNGKQTEKTFLVVRKKITDQVRTFYQA